MAKNPSASAVLVEAVHKVFTSRGETLVVLDGVDLELDRGESVAIMGPSGSGKSTLLHIVGTLEAPTSGRITLQGHNPLALRPNALADFRNQEIGFVFQDHHLLPQCTAQENVLVPVLVNRTSRLGALKRSRGLLERLGLGDRMESRPADLSGGERQRVAVARALINSPGILLCDEPTGNLDESAGRAIGECFRSLQEENQVALVVVTHNAGFAAHFDRILSLENGKLKDPSSSAEQTPPDWKTEA